MALKEMKDQLRYKYKIKRKYFRHSAREVADGAISDVALAALSAYDSFLIYYSFGSETDTHAIISALLSAGKRVFLPRVEGENIAPVQYFGDQSKLVKNSMGIYEPQGQAYAGEIEVCVTPLLAVNPRGFRLGYGGGYYDRFFAANENILKVGLGYYLQLTDEFCEEPHDIALDLFITEKGIIYFGR